ncbi:MAG: family 10 glycosylhydrolase [Peptococcaceae bacterium]|nr:family 10 glycosylhydrolase [Peptococcaceae bacterium]
MTKYQIIKICLAVIALLGLSCPAAMEYPPPSGTAVIKNQSTDFRAVWVASVLNLDYPSRPSLTVDDVKAEAVAILDSAKNIGFNAVILQVRPTCDAFYPSDLFPWSAYLSGIQDFTVAADFDPLAFWIDEAHQRGMELHAWVNPYRVTRDGQPDQPADLAKLSPNNPAVQNPGWRVLHTDGNYYLDPGLPEVRNYIVDGIREIITRYQVNGIHYDDYFYPDTGFSDDATYATYGAGSPRDEWRRENVNHLVKATYDTVKSVKPAVRFGISPAGIWQNSKTSPQGSQTEGYETYINHYADCVTWIQNHWIDYICPQIYWEIGFPIANYSVLLEWWANVVHQSRVDLYIGQAAYRVASGKTVDDPWYGVGEIIRQLNLNADYPEVKGHIMFRWGSFADNPILGALVRDYYLTHNNTTTLANAGFTHPALPAVLFPQLAPSLVVGRPSSESVNASQNKYCILGASDPSVPLQVNGEEILDRTHDGYFSYYAALSPGANSFVFTQEGQNTVTRLINYGGGGGGGSSGGTSGGTSGGAGANANGTNGGPKVVPTPSDQHPRAEISIPYAYIFLNPTTSGGPIGDLMQGQIDSIVAATEDGKWIKLGIGVWVQATDIQRTNDQPFRNTVSAPAYTTGDKWDRVVYALTDPATATTTFDGKQLTLKIRGESSDNAKPALPETSPFGRIDATVANSGADSGDDSTIGAITTHVFTLNEGQKIEGYYTEIQGTTLTLHIKKRMQASDTTLPLQNFTILLDPGHGGSDPGALGPLGMLFPEKDINFTTTMKVKNELEMLGATVELTRSGDNEMSLNDRVEKNRALRPDLFLSIHANSLDESADGARVIGVSTWYRHRIAQDVCSFVFDFVWNDLTRPQTGWHEENFYVCRPTWAPSFLIETGFLCNPQEFSWLVNAQEQDRLASSIARGIAGYFMGN